MHIPGWLTSPEAILPIALFGVSSAISIFAADIRRFLQLPKHKWRDWRIETARARLLWLIRLQRNPYELLLFFLSNLAQTVIAVSGNVIVLLSALAIFEAIRKSQIPQTYFMSYLVWAGSLGALLGRARGLLRVIDGLYRYEKTTNRLREDLKRLGASDEVWKTILEAENETPSRPNSTARIAKLEAELKRLTGEADKTLASQNPTKPSSGKGLRQPILRGLGFQKVGMTVEGQQLVFKPPSGYAVFIQNSEQRFETVAHNVKASLTLRFIGGKELRVEDAPWFQSSSSSLGAHYHQSVTLGMLESAGIVCIFQDANDRYYTALYCDEKRPKPGEPLANGQWDVEIHVDGDNVTESYKWRMQLLPAGAIEAEAQNLAP